jgi:hypothetical protein
VQCHNSSPRFRLRRSTLHIESHEGRYDKLQRSYTSVGSISTRVRLVLLTHVGAQHKEPISPMR